MKSCHKLSPIQCEKFSSLLIIIKFTFKPDFQSCLTPKQIGYFEYNSKFMIHKKYYLYPRYEKKINFIIMLHACEIN